MKLISCFFFFFKLTTNVLKFVFDHYSENPRQSHKYLCDIKHGPQIKGVMKR